MWVYFCLVYSSSTKRFFLKILIKILSIVESGLGSGVKVNDNLITVALAVWHEASPGKKNVFDFLF